MRDDAFFVGPVSGGLTSSTRLMVVTTTSAAALAAGSALGSYSGEDRSAAMILLTLLTGGLMIGAALLRLSRYIRFVSYSVMLGFLTGIAVNMVLGQIPDLLGIDADGPVSIVKAWHALLQLASAEPAAALCGGAALALLVLLGLTRLFSMELLGGAAAVAALVLIQGAGVAEAVPNPDGSRGSTRRDFAAGAASRWAAIWSGLWMAVILLAFSGVVGKVAMPTLAAVLIYAGAKSVSPRELVAVARAGRISALAMGATFTAVLALPVAQAVGVGVIVSLILQLNQEALDLKVVRLERDTTGHLIESRPPHAVSAGEVVLLDAYGSLFYAGARTLQRRLPVPVAGQSEPGQAGPVVILRLRGRNTLGATFLKVVGDYSRALSDARGELYLTGVDPELATTWEHDGTVKGLAGVHIRPATPRLGDSTRAATAATVPFPTGPIRTGPFPTNPEISDVSPRRRARRRDRHRAADRPGRCRAGVRRDAPGRPVPVLRRRPVRRRGDRGKVVRAGAGRRSGPLAARRRGSRGGAAGDLWRPQDTTGVVLVLVLWCVLAVVGYGVQRRGATPSAG